MRRSLTLPYHTLLRATTTTTHITNAPNYRLLQPSLYGTFTNSSKRTFNFNFNLFSKSVASFAVSGALTSAAVASLFLSDNAQAKEHIPSQFLPKEVVLYQYEACPFCNKVKGWLFIYLFGCSIILF